jgi:hypothetical protein
VWAIGIGHIRRELRCEVGAFDRYRGRCPVTPRRSSCGQVHPEITAGKRALIDDVAAMIPAGELVPLRDFNGTVFMVAAADLARYQEMTGGLGAWPAAAVPLEATREHQFGNPECPYPLHDMPGAEVLNPATVPGLAGAPETGLFEEPGTRAPTRPWREQVYLADLPALVSGYCPGCRTARLTHGRKLCQACSLLMSMGRPPAGIA